jgi:aspartate racemase
MPGPALSTEALDPRAAIACGTQGSHRDAATSMDTPPPGRPGTGPAPLDAGPSDASSMRTLGLLGGLSWKATIQYYDHLNKRGNAHLGRSHSPPLMIDSLDFEHVAQLLARSEDEALLRYLDTSARRLIEAGCDAVLICCNSAHKVARRLSDGLPRPLIDIRHAVTRELRRRGMRSTALLGTRLTMESRFYRDELEAAGIRCLTPDEPDRRDLNDIIMRELSVGRVEPASRQRLIEIARRLAAQGAESAVLACTELPLALSEDDFDFPVVDASLAHAESAFAFSLGTEGRS